MARRTAKHYNFGSRHQDDIGADAEFPQNTHLLDAMGFDPVGLEALQARTNLATADLQAQLMGLELDGQVARLAGGLFQRQGD